MRDTPGSLIRLAALTAAISFCGFLCPTFANAAGPPKEVKRYYKLIGKADRQLEAGKYDKVLRTAEKIAVLAPEGTYEPYLRAVARAGLGDLDMAFEALELGFERGGFDAQALRRDEQFAPLRDDPRFEAWLEKMERAEEDYRERMRTAHRRLDPSTAEAFATYAELAESFDERRGQLDARQPFLNWRRWSDRRNALSDERLAALERYLTDHPDAADAQEATLDAVRVADSYKTWSYYQDGDAALVIEQAERYLDRWPAGERRAEVELRRAIATWQAHGLEDAEETQERRAEAALPLFQRIESKYPEAPEADRAAIWQIGIGFELAGNRLTPELSARYAEVESRFEENEQLAEYAWRRATPLMFQINGERAFEGTDLDGRLWTWQTMTGKVVLIDFWATWCGPCIREVPYLQEAYETYHDRGFEIVGVSLDGPDREEFLASCEENGVVWPQIWDGGGWDAELARRFHIQGVPTPVLVDREGRVVAVNGDARGERLLERIAELVDARPRVEAVPGKGAGLEHRR